MSQLQGPSRRWPASGIRLLLLAVVAGGLALVPSGTAQALYGALTQAAYTQGCVVASNSPAASVCSTGRAMDGVGDLVVSPDGQNVYAVSYNADALVVLDRDPETGAVWQRATSSGCLSTSGSNNCRTARGMDGARSVAISPDGSSVYVASIEGDAVAVFDRGADGSLTQKAGAAGCVSNSGGEGCAQGRALDGAAALSVSPDGTNVYVAAQFSDALVALRRDASGSLTQPADPAGCMARSIASCSQAPELDGPLGVTVAPDGANVYVASFDGDAVSTFYRPDSTGALVRGGCIANTAVLGCVDGAGLDGPASITISPDGQDAYATAYSSSTVATFDRNPASTPVPGVLTQKSGAAGCFAESLTGNPDACVNGRGLLRPIDVAVAPDGSHVYVASAGNDAVAALSRDADGLLTQQQNQYGCTSETENGGECADGVALDGAHGVDVSPDGRSVYVASNVSDGVAALDRDPDPADDGTPMLGGVTQQAGTAGCVGDWHNEYQCWNGNGLNGATASVVSSDGRHVYVASAGSGAVTIFNRDPATGTLVQRGGSASPAGCISESGSAGTCVNGRGLWGASDVAISPDGLNVYVTSPGSDAIAIFARNPDSGALTQLPGLSGCWSETGADDCTNGHLLDGATSIEVSPDGNNVYVASRDSDAVLVLDREPETGKLWLPLYTHCYSATGTGGDCYVNAALDGASSVALAPDGRTVYVAAAGSGTVSSYERFLYNGLIRARESTTGLRSMAGVTSVVVAPEGNVVYAASPVTDTVATFFDTGTRLQQRELHAGCLSHSGGSGCGKGRGLDGVTSVTVSPDGKSVYAASPATSTVAVFTPGYRGFLQQDVGAGGCVAPSGATWCTSGREMNGATGVSVSPDGANVYVTANASHTVAVFDRATE